MAVILLSDVASYYFGTDWTRMLVDFGISEYHASDFHGGRGDFRGWTAAQKSAFQKHAVDILLKWRVKHGAVGVPWDDFKRSFAETGFHKTLKPAVAKWKNLIFMPFNRWCWISESTPTTSPRAATLGRFLTSAKSSWAKLNRTTRPITVMAGWVGCGFPIPRNLFSCKRRTFLSGNTGYTWNDDSYVEIALPTQ